jgi:hypothetical protein
VGVHDDQIDALGLLGRLLDDMASGRKDVPKTGQKEDRWARAFRNQSGGQQSWKSV